MRPVAVGDIHGRLDLLDALIARFPDRTFVFLGDYVDRGPESRGCIQRVRELVEAGRAVACMGNHDLFLIESVLNGADDVIWLMNGGDTTVNNYGEDWAALTADALWLQEHLKPWHVADGVLYAHAMRPHESEPDAHLWGRPDSTPVYPLPEGVMVSVHGHTPMESCPLPVGMKDGTRLWFIDTGAVWTGKLCALDCETMQPTVVEVAP